MFNKELKAEIVLQDCKHSILSYNLNLQSEELRIKWICIVILLRAVGHVLLNVDTKLNAKLKEVIHAKFKEINSQKEKHKIYHEFIKKERDRFLKEYEHGIIRILRPKPSVHIAGFSSSSDVSKNRGAIIVPSETDEMVSYIASGPFKGKYEKDVAQMAYEWWKTIINEIKREYNN